MKKSVKWICIIAVLSIVFGGVLFGTGRLLGGSNEQTFGFENNIVGFEKKIINAENCVSKKYDIKEFDTLKMENSYVDIDVVKGDKYELEVHVPEECLPQIDENSGILTIKQPKETMNMGVSIYNVDLYYRLYIPGEDVIDASLGTTSGDIKVEDVNLKGEINLTSGNIAMKGVTSSNMGIGATSGEVFLSDCRFENCTAVCTSGNVCIDGTASENLSVSTTSGEVKCVNAEADKVAVRTTSGESKFENVIANEVAVNFTSGGLEAEELTVNMLTVNGTSGEVELKLKESTDEYSYNLNSVSGDIKVGDTIAEKTYISKGNTEKKIVVETTSGDIEIR